MPTDGRCDLTRRLNGEISIIIKQNAVKASRNIHWLVLTLILLTWRIWWAPNNASSWQVGFNSAFKGLIWCVSIVHDKTKKEECDKRLWGSQLYDSLRAGAMDVANYQAAKQFGALPNWQFVPLCPAPLCTLPFTRREDMLSAWWKNLTTPLATNAH